MHVRLRRQIRAINIMIPYRSHYFGGLYTLSHQTSVSMLHLYI